MVRLQTGHKLLPVQMMIQFAQHIIKLFWFKNIVLWVVSSQNTSILYFDAMSGQKTKNNVDNM